MLLTPFSVCKMQIRPDKNLWFLPKLCLQDTLVKCLSFLMLMMFSEARIQWPHGSFKSNFIRHVPMECYIFSKPILSTSSHVVELRAGLSLKKKKKRCLGWSCFWGKGLCYVILRMKPWSVLPVVSSLCYKIQTQGGSSSSMLYFCS